MATRTPGNVNPGVLKWTALEGDPAMIRRLTAVAELDPDEAAKRNAVCGLSRMSDEAATPGLLIGLGTSDRATRRWAITGLEKLRARDAVPELVRLLNDLHLRHVAAAALVAIRDERGLPPLRAAARRGWPLTRRRMRRRVRALEQGLGD
jgi:HEAT repeat protein